MPYTYLQNIQKLLPQTGHNAAMFRLSNDLKSINEFSLLSAHGPPEFVTIQLNLIDQISKSVEIYMSASNIYFALLEVPSIS